MWLLVVPGFKGKEKAGTLCSIKTNTRVNLGSKVIVYIVQIEINSSLGIHLFDIFFPELARQTGNLFS